MKYLIVIASIIISLVANAQSKIGSTAQEIYEEFGLEDITYKYTPDGELYIVNCQDSNKKVQYLLSEDSICTSMLIGVYTKEMTDSIIENYTRKGYLKTYDGWLMRDNGVIYTIRYFEDENVGNFFYWY
jgi:hypothetical protein